MTASDRVVLIHGRDREARHAVEELLRALGLVPISFESEAAFSDDGTPHNLDVFKRALEGVGAAVVLWTGDEVALTRGRFREADESKEQVGPVRQPRPNVLLEHGWALATLGRRVIVVKVGECRTPSDLAGHNYVELVRARDCDRFRQQLADRLSNVGCPVRRSEQWLHAGDFASLVERERSDRTLHWIHAGVSVRETQYRFAELMDPECKEVIITGHNFADVLGTVASPKEHLTRPLKELLSISDRATVTLVFAPPEILRVTQPVGYADLVEHSLPRLRALVDDPELSAQQRRRLVIGSHPGALAFPCFLRDPTSVEPGRALLVATPRWISDQTGDARMFFAIKKSEDPELFRALAHPIASDLRIPGKWRSLDQVFAALALAPTPD